MHVLGTQNNISVLLSFNLREDWFLRMKNTHFRLGFTRFLVISGPWAHHYFSRQAREVILMGPRTGNDQKTGKTRRKWVFFILRNQSALKLKKVVHITVYYFSLEIELNWHKIRLWNSITSNLMSRLSNLMRVEVWSFIKRFSTASTKFGGSLFLNRRSWRKSDRK